MEPYGTVVPSYRTSLDHIAKSIYRGGFYPDLVFRGQRESIV